MEQQLSILGTVLLAMVLGAVVGLERELSDKPAGFRTHMLVAGAAALLVAVGELLVELQPNTQGTVRSDPVRIIEAVITGVSFLGAGTIIRLADAGRVEGLTTAASLLFVAAIGICVAVHQFLLAVGAMVIALAVLRGGRYVDRWVSRDS